MNKHRLSTPHPNVTTSDLLLAVGAVLFLNAGFLLVAQAVDAPRPWINLDYAIALTLFAFGFHTLGAVLGTGFLLSDTLVLVGQVLPFPRLSDLFYLLKFTALASVLHQALIFGLAALIVTKLIGLLLTGRRVKPLSALIVLNTLAATMFLLFHLNGHESISPKTWRTQTPLIASMTSSLVSMRSSTFWDFFKHEGPALNTVRVGNSAAWDPNFVAEQHSRLLLIVVETWGVPFNQDIERAMLEPLRQVADAPLKTGRIKFNGFTLDGELRELCRLTANHFNLRYVETGFENCLPNRLQAAGYKTASMHGANSTMYDRRHWYPRAGFEEMTFFEDKVWPQRCYSFPGACDLDMLPGIEKFFSQPGKRFMYWLTLNTHAPYDLRDLRTDYFNCEDYEIPADTDSCRLLKLQVEFFNGLAKQLRSDAMRNIELILVGDHAPKLMNHEEKKKYFFANTVPWVRLKTKG